MIEARIRERQFTHNGRDLFVRAWVEGDHWVIGIFEGNNQVTEVQYTISHITAVDGMVANGINLVDSLMDVARQDVLRNWVIVR